jgi:hypothetical protein
MQVHTHKHKLWFFLSPAQTPDLTETACGPVEIRRVSALYIPVLPNQVGGDIREKPGHAHKINEYMDAWCP